MNKNDKELGTTEYFELREKRLKLVYKILYVIVAIWIAVILNIGDEALIKDIVPAYAFLLSVTSLMIIRIIKYALMEFRCMKVVGDNDEAIIKQTEIYYDNIWKSFGFQLAFAVELMICNVIFPRIFSVNVLPWIAVVCVSYFLITSFIGIFKTVKSVYVIKILDTISVLIGTITAYTICDLICLVAI